MCLYVSTTYSSCGYCHLGILACTNTYDVVMVVKTWWSRKGGDGGIIRSCERTRGSQPTEFYCSTYTDTGTQTFMSHTRKLSNAIQEGSAW